jgi:uncharacterized protein YjiS (DUF1127 family)
MLMSRVQAGKKQIMSQNSVQALSQVDSNLLVTDCALKDSGILRNDREAGS